MGYTPGMVVALTEKAVLMITGQCVSVPTFKLLRKTDKACNCGDKSAQWEAISLQGNKCKIFECTIEEVRNY